MVAGFSMNSYTGQRILSLVRKGDYAHAGEEEAIDLAMSGVEKKSGQVILDAGCGRGGTANYLHRNDWGRVIGIDIEARSIDAARQSYPECTFVTCDVVDVSKHVEQRPDIICMFNAFYCFKDQQKALAALWNLARPHTRLIIFDHVDRGGYQIDPLMDVGEPFLPNPLQLDDVSDTLMTVGWQAPAVRDLSAEYVRWYAALVARIENARETIVAIAGEHGYAHVIRLYRGLLSVAQHGKLGAAVISTSRAR